MSDEIIDLHHWFESPPGKYLLEWEQACYDEAVADLFGYHALQLGTPWLQGLNNSRMPRRWLALSGAFQGLADPITAQLAPTLWAEAAALPFAENSLDLVLLPHTLELCPDPHAALREVARVLLPEGRVVISGFNTTSLWGLRPARGRHAGKSDAYLPGAIEHIGYWRLRDWLRLLGFEVEHAHFGCYRPAVRSVRWLERYRWLDTLGPRWWPILGAAYCVVAVKRVHGARLLEPGWRKAQAPASAPVRVANRGNVHRRTPGPGN
jgi:SAM-dependent methyltransferase